MGITLPRLVYDIVPPKYGPAARYTWTTLKARSLPSLWSSIAHLVNQSMGDSHLSSQSLRSYHLQIRSRLGL